MIFPGVLVEGRSEKRLGTNLHNATLCCLFYQPEKTYRVDNPTVVTAWVWDDKSGSWTLLECENPLAGMTPTAETQGTGGTTAAMAFVRSMAVK